MCKLIQKRIPWTPIPFVCQMDSYPDCIPIPPTGQHFYYHVLPNELINKTQAFVIILDHPKGCMPANKNTNPPVLPRLLIGVSCLLQMIGCVWYLASDSGPAHTMLFYIFGNNFLLRWLTG